MGARRGGGKTGAQKADEAWKQLLALRKKYGVPQANHPTEVQDGWASSYEMGPTNVQRMREAVKVLYEAFGKVPWHHEPKERVK